MRTERVIITAVWAYTKADKTLDYCLVYARGKDGVTHCYFTTDELLASWAKAKHTTRWMRDPIRLDVTYSETPKGRRLEIPAELEQAS